MTDASPRPRRTWPQRLVILINVAGIVAALFAAAALSSGEQVVTSVQRVQLAGSLTPAEPSTENGERVLNVLLVGYDSSSNLEPNDPVQLGRLGEANGDVLILARIDEIRRSATLLSIPRDLWVPISTDGRERKINAAFALGGAEAMVETVEQNLGVPINHFASVDFAGFQGIVDVVDHVEFFFDRPARDFNEQPTSGPPRSMTGFEVLERGCVALSPEQSLAFVRSRNYQTQQDDGSWAYVQNGNNDLSRIERQQAFLEALVARSIEVGARNPFVLRDLVEEGVQHVTIDQELTAQALLDLGRTFNSFEPSQLESYRLPTEFEFVQSRDGARISIVRQLPAESEPILALMRGEDPTAPSTVDVKIEAVTRPDGDRALEQLDAAGFVVSEVRTSADAPPGVTILHSTKGAAAAQVLIDALLTTDPDFLANTVLTLDESLAGRTVVVRLGPEPEPEPEVDAAAEAAADGLNEDRADAPSTPSTSVPAAATTAPDAEIDDGTNEASPELVALSSATESCSSGGS